MATQSDVIVTNKWSVAYVHENQNVILMFQFSDRSPINLAIYRENAEQIANAILGAYRNPPPKPGTSVLF